MTDQQQGWGPPQQPPWEQSQQPYGGPQHYPGQPQQPGNGYGRATSPPGDQQPPGYGYQPPPQQGYPSGPPAGHQAPRPKKGHRVRNTILGVVGGLVVIIIIASVASSHDGVTKLSSPSAARAATTAPASPSPEPASNSTTGPVGTTFTVTDTSNNGATVKYSVTLDKVIQHAQPDNSFDSAPAGDHLAAAEFTIRGLVGADQDDANNDAAAVGTNSETYQTGLEGVAAGTSFNGGQFNTSPGSASIGWVSFEVKDGVKVSSIQWNPDSGMSGSAPATWTVGR
jgi:hypothetical protein